MYQAYAITNLGLSGTYAITNLGLSGTRNHKSKAETYTPANHDLKLSGTTRQHHEQVMSGTMLSSRRRFACLASSRSTPTYPSLSRSRLYSFPIRPSSSETTPQSPKTKRRLKTHNNYRSVGLGAENRDEQRVFVWTHVISNVGG